MTEQNQREACGIQFNNIISRLEKIEKHNSDVQDAKLESIGEAVITFKMFMEKQDETMNRIVTEFTENRKENLAIHKEKDRTLQCLTNNMLEMSNTLSNVNISIEQLNSKLERQEQKIDEMDSKGKVDWIKAFQQGIFNIITSAITAITFGYLIFQYLDKK